MTPTERNPTMPSIEEVLQIAHDAVVNHSRASLYALADALEEAGMQPQAQEVRLDRPVPDRMLCRLRVGSRHFDLSIKLVELFRLIAQQAAKNQTPKSTWCYGTPVSRLVVHCS